MEEEEKMTVEEAGTLVTLVNTALDIMNGLPLGTTTDGNKQLAGKIEEVINKNGGLSYCKIDDEQIPLISSLVICGYNYFGAEFIEQLVKEYPEFTKSVIFCLAKSLAGNDLQ